MEFYKTISKNVDLAIIEAICTFGKDEGKFSETINRYYKMFNECRKVSDKNNIVLAYTESFKEFAVVFKIIRNLDKDSKKRQKLINIIFNKYLPSLDTEQQYINVDKFAEMAKNLGLTHNKKTTSAFSKIAFLYKPQIYFPYDRTAKESMKIYMKEKNIKTNIDGNYENYSRVVEQAYYEFKEKFNVGNHIENKNYLKSNIKINNKLFEARIERLITYCEILHIGNINEFISRRAFDKSLMLFGGFKEENLIAFKDSIITERF